MQIFIRLTCTLLLLLLSCGNALAREKAPRSDIEPGIEDHIDLIKVPSSGPRGAKGDASAQAPQGTIIELPIEAAYQPLVRGSAQDPRNYLEGVRMVAIPGETRQESLDRLNRIYLYIEGNDLEVLPETERAALPAPRPGYVYARVAGSGGAGLYQSRFVQRPNIPLAATLRELQRRTQRDRTQAPGAISVADVCELAQGDLARAYQPRRVARESVVRGLPPRDFDPREVEAAPTGEPLAASGQRQSREQDLTELRAARSLSDLRPQNEKEAQILRALARTEPQANVPIVAVARLLFFLRHPPPGNDVRNQRYFTIVDYSQPSNNRRFFVIDTESGRTDVHAAGHGVGRGGTRNSREMARLFSNIADTNLPSKGFMRIGGPHSRFESREGGRRRALTLYGLQPGVNDRVHARGILLHDSDYVSNLRADARQAQGGSAGCVVLDNRSMRQLRGPLQQSLMLVHSAQDRDIDYTRDRAN